MAKVNWKLDPAHSEVKFKVKHMMIANVSGQFNEFNVKAVSEDGNFLNGEIDFWLNVNSIDTANEQRDQHLRSADFFDAETQPKIKFSSTGIKKIDNEGNFDLEGDLTIKGIKKPIKLKGEFGGINKDPWGNEKAGFSLEGKINRKEFDLNWNAALETGGVLVGEDVKIACEIQLVKE